MKPIKRSATAYPSHNTFQSERRRLLKLMGQGALILSGSGFLGCITEEEDVDAGAQAVDYGPLYDACGPSAPCQADTGGGGGGGAPDYDYGGVAGGGAGYNGDWGTPDANIDGLRVPSEGEIYYISGIFELRYFIEVFHPEEALRRFIEDDFEGLMTLLNQAITDENLSCTSDDDLPDVDIAAEAMRRALIAELGLSTPPALNVTFVGCQEQLGGAAPGW
ncbi:hypothetical protein KKF91_14820 [Myxococcota bacterium]|nr:hypothetical protein [Myxococcota bacterium]MBU1431812.1 hypothetical protein [Myxococcota bacterium]MBU1899604.1 hypothetical protein [Myxococcota bacterium]